MPVLVFPDDSHRIVVAPVHGKVAVGCHGPVIFIGYRRAQGQGQRIGVVIRVQGNGYAVRRIFCLDLVIRDKYTGGIVHPVVGKR